MYKRKIALTTTLAIVFFTTIVVQADPPSHSPNDLLKEADRRSQNPESSPVRRIDRNPNKRNRSRRDQKDVTYRNIDGSNNNVNNPEMNTIDTPLLRLASADYSDGISALAGTARLSPREISNIILAQSELVPNPKNASDFLWQWGQFLDHDMDITEGSVPAETADIPVPAGDVFFDPSNLGDVVMSFNRSYYDVHSGTGTDNPRQQNNEITGWIDASNVHGSDEDRAAALRALDGTGKLKTSAGNLLPFNVNGLGNAGGPSETLFLAGDVRANEQAALSAMHTLFVREHNRLAEKITQKNADLSGDEVYEQARRIVAAQMQVITYQEFLPVLLGRNALSRYRGYKPEVDATISNEFSTAAYRLGHSLLSPKILRLDENGNEVAQGHLALREAFFAPHRIIDEGGIEPILRGLAAQTCQHLDNLIIDDVRNFLFGQPGDGGFDLASLNIQRGRDHGLSDYNSTCVALGLAPATSFADISSNTETQAKLAEAYENVDDIDAWVGGLAEDTINGALVGELFLAILKDQFERLRDGDRFWYENHFNGRELRAIKGTTLAQIIRRNTSIGNEIQANVFLVSSGRSDGKKRKQQPRTPLSVFEAR